MRKEEERSFAVEMQCVFKWMRRDGWTFCERTITSKKQSMQHFTNIPYIKYANRETKKKETPTSDKERDDYRFCQEWHTEGTI